MEGTSSNAGKMSIIVRVAGATGKRRHIAPVLQRRRKPRIITPDWETPVQTNI
jgi:hypothetical protein